MTPWKAYGVRELVELRVDHLEDKLSESMLNDEAHKVALQGIEYLGI